MSKLRTAILYIIFFFSATERIAECGGTKKIGGPGEGTSEFLGLWTPLEQFWDSMPS